ncbi:MAG: VOC family protein [Pseudomonadota bacterium]
MHVREVNSAKVSGIGGFFIRARNPGKMRAWYRDVLGIGRSDDVVWQQAPGPTIFAPYAERSTYFGRQDQSFMLNFRVDNLAAMIEELTATGIRVETRPGEWDNDTGRFARIHDPEGNPIELWEPAA